ncbi:MAG: hypothetical protein MZW92_69360 [Comamonadaceae bacterium]|nr:hypothetical protein [Comamonadaceae bacterium]
MKPADAPIDRLAIARQLLLEPYGLDESGAAAGARRGSSSTTPTSPTCTSSTTRHEALAPRGRHRQERQLRASTRAWACARSAGEKTAFAYSRRPVRGQRCSTRRAPCAPSPRAGQQRRVQAGAHAAPRPRSRALYAPTDPIATLDSAQKVGAARARSSSWRARKRPARRAGDGQRGRRVRRGAGGAQPTARRLIAPTCGRWCGCR